MPTRTRDFYSQVVRVSDLAVTGPVIEGYTFENCLVLGPAVVAVLSDVSFESSQWVTDPGESSESLWWEVDEGHRVGAIGIRNCSFVGCVFQGVGFAGTKETIAILREGISS